MLSKRVKEYNKLQELVSRCIVANLEITDEKSLQEFTKIFSEFQNKFKESDEDIQSWILSKNTYFSMLVVAIKEGVCLNCLIEKDIEIETNTEFKTVKEKADEIEQWILKNKMEEE